MLLDVRCNVGILVSFKLMLNWVARRQRDDIALLVEFNEPMARQDLGSGDFCLRPSRFEPCSLVQMQVQRHGTTPRAGSPTRSRVESSASCFLVSRSRRYSRHADSFAAFRDQDKSAEMRRAATSSRFA
jgi:hypothetical protein